MRIPEVVELVGGPLDGERLDLSALAPGERAEGVALVSERGAGGPGGRSLYGPSPDLGPSRWAWEGDVP